MARMAKVDYKKEKIPVSCTGKMKDDIEKEAERLGISAPGLLRILFVKFGKSLRPEDL